MQHAEAISRVQQIVSPTQNADVRRVVRAMPCKRYAVIEFEKCPSAEASTIC